MKKLSSLTALLLLTAFLQAQTPAIIKDINPGASSGFSSTEGSLAALGNIVYFSANDGSSGSELWRSDGTAAGTYMVKDIQPGSAGSAPIRLSVLGNQILFFANDGTHGDELWASDGTEAGTVLVKDIKPGAGHGIRRNYLPQVRDWLVHGGALFFAADTGTGFSQLWRSDGTEAGTVFVFNPCPGCNANNFATGEFTTMNDTLYFVGGFDLWRSDGTTAGTIKVIDSSDDSGPRSFKNLTGIGGLLYISGGIDIFSLDLWVSNGTKAGTRPVKDLTDKGDPRQFTAMNGKVFFIADAHLWSTDATAAGTQQVSSLMVDNSLVKKNNLYVWKNALYFKVINASNKCYLYKTDGTPDAEVEVFQQNTQLANFFDPVYYASTDDYLYYNAATQSPYGAGIGRVNSTGTEKMVIYADRDPENLILAGNNLFFRSGSSATGWELWKLSLATSATPNIQNDLALKIYPTLSSDGVFQLQYSGAETATFDVRVFDALGRQVFQTDQTFDMPLRLQHLSAGTYLVRVAARDGRAFAQRVVIGQ